MRTLFALAAALPVAAFAQIGGPQIALDFSGQSSTVVTAASCGGQLTVNYGVTNLQTFLTCSGLVIWVTSGTCGTDPGAADLTVATVANSTLLTAPSGSEKINVNDLPVFSGSAADGGTGTTCGAPIEDTMTVCAALKYATSSFNGCGSPTTAQAVRAPTIRYDNKAPDPPAIDSVTSLDSALSVTVSNVASDAALIHLGYRVQGDPSFSSGGGFTADQSTGKITGLTNGVLYEVVASVEDAAGNVSGDSPIATGTPVHTEGFFDKYVAAGGRERGGCAIAGGGLVAWAAAIALSRLARRRR